MQPEMTRRLEQLRQRAEELGRLATEAHGAVPETTEGVDVSGCARILLGQDRMPIQITIRERWQDRLDADALASAVMDANTEAVGNAYRAWSDRLDDSAWRLRQRDAEMPERRTTPMASPPREPQMWPTSENPEMGEQILRLLHDTRPNASHPLPADVQGSDDNGSVSVHLSPGGLAGCVIDEGWARHRRGDDITAAISRALGQARRRLTSPRAGLQEADALIGEALAALAALTDRARDGGGRR